MKKFINAFLLFALTSISIAFCMAGCVQGNEDASHEKFDGNPDGAYFITDECYKKINTTRPQQLFRCVIANNQMMLTGMENNVYHVYDISFESNASFKGVSVTETISFWFNGNILCIDCDGQTMQFEEDKTYQMADERAVLSAPRDIEIFSGGEGGDFVKFQWNYQSDYGNFGVGIDIKTANSQEYQPVKMIERVYMNMFTVQFDKSYFKTGENHIRLYNIGGLEITNEHSIVVTKNSDYVTYSVMVNNDESVEVKHIIPNS